VLDKLKITASTKLDGISDKKWNTLLYNDSPKAPGLVLVLEKELATTTRAGRQEQLEDLRSDVVCQTCQGTRLSAQANSVLINDKTISQICALPVEEAVTFFEDLEFEGNRAIVAAPVLKELRQRIRFLNQIGVGYLTLDRRADSLSGGEFQRVRLAASIGSGLTSVCYVLDEPSIGLHPRDNDRLIESIRNLQQAGNSIIVVEHDEAMMLAADHLIDIGPRAGKNGGQIVAAGTPDEVAACTSSLTGDYLAGREMIEVPMVRRAAAGQGSWIEVKGASGFNLQNVDVAIPLGALVVVTGVSGSGKSTLINRTVYPAVARHLELAAPRSEKFKSIDGIDNIDKLIPIDQKPVGRTPRGCAATYTGVFDEIRKVFAATKTAREKGFTHSRFSFNSSRGWCPECRGHGLQRIKMNFLADMFVKCDTCNGRRFNMQTLQVRYNDLTIADVLELRVSEALEFFENFSRIHRIVRSLDDVGLGYLPLGQPSTTLSGGEAQRIKLATELARTQTGDTLYLLDEPTTGLHHDDVKRLLGVLMQLVESGNTVIVIEHNLDVIKSADWIIDMGPGGGKHGGTVVATGTPEDVARIEESYTGQFLRELLKKR
ncbi:MAG: excinuclease ABC subunit UvrA, partial [Planctomycetota bacterium]